MSAADEPVKGGLLQHRFFVFLWFARLFATIGYQALAVVIGWSIYEITGSAFDLGYFARASGRTLRGPPHQRLDAEAARKRDARNTNRKNWRSHRGRPCHRPA